MGVSRGDIAFGCNYSLGGRLFADLHRSLGEENFWQAGSIWRRKPDDADDRRGTSVGINHAGKLFA